MTSQELADFLNYNSLQFAFLEALLIIVLVCFFVTLATRLGLGSVIGYLAAGVGGSALITLSFSDHPEDLLHFAEFGIVLFLFVIGMEFSPARLWALRKAILGRGLVQLLACGALLGGVAYLYGLDWRAALIVGLGLALSSTALVMQEIDQKGQRHSDYGQTAISVLLFEDLAIVPLLILVALIAPSTGDAQSLHDGATAFSLAMGATVLLIAFGRYLMEPMLHAVARTGAPELMTASALGVVIAAGGLMIAVNLSPAMGAFIAGVMLANSTYRHEIEANIEPFRGLFIGLFFLAVGKSLDLGAVAENALLIVLAVPVLIILKSTMIYVVSRAFGSTHQTSLMISFGMSQHGEFGFVLFAAASTAGLIDNATAAIVVSIVTLSMILSSQSDRLLDLVLREDEETLEEDYADANGDVLIVGFGRFGQIVSQPLLDAGFSVTLLDKNVRRIREAEQFGTKVFFGDGRRKEVLEAAGAGDARVIVVCVDARDTSKKVTRLVGTHFDNAALAVRALDRGHAIELAREGIIVFERETFQSALVLSSQILTQLGLERPEADDFAARFAERDQERLEHQVLEASGHTDDLEPERLT